jgi:hypothetical protein
MRTARLVAAGGIALIALGGAGIMTARGATPSVGSFTVSARADAVAIDIVDPAAPLFPNGEITDATPGTAQARLDSLGESDAFASSPYPGDSIAGLPSLINGLGGSGALPPLPAYPFIVNSSYPSTPTADQTQGPYSLTASSSTNASAAAARTGVVTSSSPSVANIDAAATASLDPTTGKMTASADDITDALSFGSLLTVGDISSHAKLVDVPGMPASLQSSFSVGSTTIAGITVGFTDKGLQLGPDTFSPVLPAVLNALLAKAGITVTYLPAVRTPTSLESGGLAITVAMNVPSQGIVSATTTLGRVSVETASVIAAPAATATPAPFSPAPVPPAATPVALPAVAPAPLPAVLAAPVPRRLPPTVEPAASVLAKPFLGHFTTWLYLLLAGVGIALLIASALFGAFGVRTHPDSPSVLQLPTS